MITESVNNHDILDICNKVNEYLIHIFKNTFPPISYRQIENDQI
jgi:hypothetical protein